MQQSIRVCYLFAVSGLLTCLAPFAQADEAASKFSRDMLMTKPVTLPSKDVETHVLRVRFPKGYKTPLHTHEGPGPRYVVMGKLKVVDDGETKVYNQGEVFWETGAEMTVENVGKGEAEIIIFELAAAKPAKH
ncbi:cupin domain-containing protein [Methylomonas fluvii]|uniref:Cupin domain-containing protein n=1 Tax=Methylomonas fluvii TaxID=1854564 RepID=A0ABR9DIC4_9GAMM|nr:cupin domain-containing protein [Methylomonas fluvii]MBD9362851.1 cupin domain-containing protein [Methylomonas fluvii]